MCYLVYKIFLEGQIIIAQIQKLKIPIMKWKFCKVCFGFNTGMQQKYNLYYLLSENLVNLGIHYIPQENHLAVLKAFFIIMHG